MSDNICLELAAEEIVTWWSQERGGTTLACQNFFESLRDRVNRQIDDLSGIHSIPGVSKRQIEAVIKAEVVEFVRHIERKLSDSCSASIQTVGDFEISHALEASDVAKYSVIGMAGAGTIGVAAASTGLATVSTTATILGIFAGGTVITFSWPIFGSVALFSLAAATVTGLGAKGIVEKQKQRMKKSAEEELFGRLIGPSSRKGVKPILIELYEQLDLARDSRLESLRQDF